MRSSGVWVYVIGIFMFVWGFCQLAYAFMDIRLPINIPFTEWGAVIGADDLFYNMQLGLAFGSMLSGFGMLIFRAWSRVLAIWLVWTFAGFFFYIFLLIGPMEFEEFFVRQFALFFAIALILLWFFNQEGTRETLNSDPVKKQKRLIPFISMLLFVSSVYLFINLPSQLPLIFTEARFPEIQQVNYPSKSRQFYKTRYERTVFPLPFTLAVPKGTTLVSLNQTSGFNHSGPCKIQLDTPGQAQSIFLTRQTSVQQEWSSPKTQKFLERIHPLNPYAYARKIFSDRRSIIHWRFRNKIGVWGGDEIHEINMQGMKGFVVKVEKQGEVFGKPIRWYFDFNLYLQDVSAGGGQLFGFKGGQTIPLNILGSLEPRWDTSKTAADYYQDGLKLSKKKRYEKAKMAFASSLCLDAQNPEVHYAMAEAFYKVRSYEQADRHLVKALEVKGDFPDDWKMFEKIQKLFEKTRKKLGKPATLESSEKT